MNKFVVAAALASLLVIGRCSWARPPYPALFIEEYKSNGDVAKLALAAKCNVCHDAAAKSKKVRNEYGKALNMHLTANDFQNLKGNKAGLVAKVSSALQATEKEKDAAGKSYGDILKSGKLPAP